MLVSYAVILPIITALLPCLHENFATDIFLKNINFGSLLFRCVLLLLHYPFMLLTGIVGYLFSALTLVTLNEIKNDLRKLW